MPKSSSRILDGCSCYVSTGEVGRSRRSEVSKAVLALGGRVQTKFVHGEVTHVIVNANAESTSRVAVLAASADKLPILDPSWILILRN